MRFFNGFVVDSPHTLFTEIISLLIKLDSTFNSIDGMCLFFHLAGANFSVIRWQFILTNNFLNEIFLCMTIEKCVDER